MDLLGVEIARTRQQRHYEKTRDKTTWVPDRALTAAQRTALADAIAAGPPGHRRVRPRPGPGLLRQRGMPVRGRVLQPAHRRRRRPPSTRSPTGTCLLVVLLHEAAHRVGHRGGGRWTPIPDYHDRMPRLRDACSATSPRSCWTTWPTAAPCPTPPTRRRRRRRHRRRRSGADDPAVPVSRRELARLLTDRLPHALAARRVRRRNDLVASTAVHPDYWRTLTNPRPAGLPPPAWARAAGPGTTTRSPCSPKRSGSTRPWSGSATTSAKAPCTAAAANSGASPARGRRRMRELTLRACTDLEALGGAYAEQVPALRALVDRPDPAPTGDDSWQAPARALIALERQRLGLDRQPT